MIVRKPRLLDPKFRYVPANKTDLRKTFAEERRRLRQLEKPREAPVLQLRKKS